MAGTPLTPDTRLEDGVRTIVELEVGAADCHILEHHQTGMMATFDVVR